MSQGATEWALGCGRIGCTEVSSIKAHGLSRMSTIVGHNIICRLEGCGLDQGQGTLVGKGQVMKSQHMMPKQLNFILQSLTVVEIGVK